MKTKIRRVIVGGEEMGSGGVCLLGMGFFYVLKKNLELDRGGILQHQEYIKCH